MRQQLRVVDESVFHAALQRLQRGLAAQIPVNAPAPSNGKCVWNRCETPRTRAPEAPNLHCFAALGQLCLLMYIVLIRRAPNIRPFASVSERDSIEQPHCLRTLQHLDGEMWGCAHSSAGKRDIHAQTGVSDADKFRLVL